jgi:taurine dioxygenase
MNISDITVQIGSLIDDVDLRVVTEAEVGSLRSALTERGVLVCRGQTLSPEDLVAFARKFGPVEYRVRDDFQLPGNPDVYVISNIVENGKPLGNPNDGFAWHTDLSFLEHPTAFTFLYAIETPPEGGNTEFASAAVSFDQLSDSEKHQYSGIAVRHSYEMLHATRKNVRPLTAEELHTMPDVVHPLVRTHPETGRKALYLGPDTSLPLDMEPESGAALIHALMDRTTQPDQVYAHVWRPGDLVVWDNHTMVHRATEYARDRYRRLMHRVTVRGERPV